MDQNSYNNDLENVEIKRRKDNYNDLNLDEAWQLLNV